MNTEINYMYRDGDNYKKWNHITVKGTLTDEQKQKIFEMCGWDSEDDNWDKDCGCPDACDEFYFIPRQVGMPEVRFGKATSADHCWFELQSIEDSKKRPSKRIDCDVQELYERFVDTEGEWDDIKYAYGCF